MLFPILHQFIYLAQEPTPLVWPVKALLIAVGVFFLLLVICPFLLSSRISQEEERRNGGGQ